MRKLPGPLLAILVIVISATAALLYSKKLPPKLNNVTIQGVHLPVSQVDRQTLLKRSREVVEKGGYSYPELNLRLQLYGGGDGGQVLTGKQLELSGKIVLTAGMPEQEVYRVLGRSDPPLIYSLDQNEGTLHHRLWVRLDELKNVSEIELRYLYSVD